MKEICYFYEHTKILIGKGTLCSWKARLENSGGRGEQRKRKNKVMCQKVGREKKNKHRRDRRKKHGISTVEEFEL
jgi:hypothetical protein